MTRMVHTTKGDLPYDELQQKDIREEGTNHITVAREWYYKGEMVRRDAWATILSGQTASAEGGRLG